jgi:ABC-type sugar transport system ATPase subunit
MRTPLNDPSCDHFITQRDSHEQTSQQLAIEVAGLTKAFGKATILNDLYLTVQQNEFLVVLGESGSGKSTLLKLLSGLDKPVAGSIRILGTDQNAIAPHRRDVAIVFQDSNGYGHLTVRKNLSLIAMRAGSQCKIAEWVDRLRISPTMDQRLEQLSGGELQRVAIARAMLSNKSIVLLDEPLSHLNPFLREEIRDLLLDVHRQCKKTFVYVTHDSEDAFYLANRIAVLAAGKIQQIGNPRVIYQKPASKAVSLLFGQPTIDIVNLPLAWLTDASADQASKIECGIRCHDWSINRIELKPEGDCTHSSGGFDISESELVLKGSIQSCHWMGDHWLLDIECGGKIRIQCDATQDGPFEVALQQAECISKSRSGNHSLGSIEATCPRSMVKLFANSQSIT